MQVRYPRSFFKLLAVGFLLAVLPLIAGLVANTLTVRQLAMQSQQAVFDAARLAHGSRRLSELAPALERAARQSLVLQDAALHAGYGRLRADYAALLAELNELPLDAPMTALLKELASMEAAAYAAHQRSGAQPGQVAALFAPLTEKTHSLLDYTKALIDREAAALHARAGEAQASARLQLLIVIPAALLVVAGFTYLLAHPIAQLEAGIRALGEQRLDKPVFVEGPEDLVKLGRELDWLRQRMATLEAQKAQFLRHVSHELKTPLTALREGSDLLAEGLAGPLSARQQEIVGIVRDNSLHLQQLIETLLRHGEAEFRGTEVEPAAFSLPALVEQVCRQQAVAMEARQIKVDARIEVQTVVSDAMRWRVILDNLLSNAVKHAPPASCITLSAGIEAGMLVLRVEDAGPGVAESEREKVFEPFYRGPTPAGTKVKSTGLGLAIVRDHVLAMHGAIEVGHAHGDFRVKIPLHSEEGRA